MKVVILSTATSYTGGAIITLLNVLALLQKKGVEPYFILKGHGQLEKTLQEKGIPFSVICSYDWCVPEQKTKGWKNHLIWTVKSIINWIAECKTYHLLDKLKADIYHLNCIYNGTGVSAAKALGIPVVWHLREFVDISGITPVFWNTDKTWKKINQADQVICVSEYLRKAYEKYLLNAMKVQVVHDGIDMSCFTPKESPISAKKEIIIGLAGTAPIKNHKDAILALQKVRELGYHVILRIAGRWAKDSYNQRYKDSLNELIIKNKVKDDVEFVGMQNDMNTFWTECDISVVCSKRESFGLAATEAMACGVPLVCSTTSISGELTEDGQNVFVYKTGDSDELAERIMECISLFGSKELKMKIKKAEQFVRESFSIEKSAEKLKAIYDEVIKMSTR